ncbi:MAG: STAS domain-containing protein [Desulfobacterales bacterium]|jgi:ABC-type transporter Mla MlaB component
MAIANSLINHLENISWKEKDMATNFKIFMHRTPDNLSIKLTGDFDGSAADELLDALQEHLNDTACICIDTNSLNKIHPFGRDVFAHHLFKLKRHHCRIKLVGKNAEQITPSEMEYLRVDRNHHEHQQQKNSWITVEAKHGNCIGVV